MIPRLSVVVPAYDEERRIGATLARIRRYFETQPYPVELVVVDDGSRDGTVAVARQALAGFPSGQLISYRPNRGKGYAVRTGIVATGGEYVLFTDADLSTPIEEVRRAFDLIERGNDLVLGSRAAGDVRVEQPPYRRLAAKLFNVVRDLIVGRSGVVDTQCGFKLFRGDVARDVFSRQRVDRFMFDAETLFVARRLGYRYAEMPVAWADAPGSKVRVVRGALELLPELLSIRLRHGHLRPGDARASHGT
ncbi:MAG TPA: dolichyl-phosphate beta-glucosyltransferase [Chloroflexota bacterium]|nr:dolichyl-phosphate beta-glucosyltransferase [Chloroflexota bacterium]